MESFRHVEGIAAPLDISNVDTDQIIPKQFLKRIERTGFGKFLFFDWRYQKDGVTPNMNFNLNAPAYQGAAVLLTGKNFGCGSSREHAPWALQDYGIRAIIAPSFADIFYNNCFKNGLLPVTLPAAEVALLIQRAETISGYRVKADLEAERVTDEYGFTAPFVIDAFRRYCLLNGLDDIGLTLQHAEAIDRFEKSRPEWLPKLTA